MTQLSIVVCRRRIGPYRHDFRKSVTLGILHVRSFCHAQADEFEAWRTSSDFHPDRGSIFRDSPAELFEQLLRLAVGVGAPYADQSCTRAEQISCNLLQHIATDLICSRATLICVWCTDTDDGG